MVPFPTPGTAPVCLCLISTSEHEMVILEPDRAVPQLWLGSLGSRLEACPRPSLADNKCLVCIDRSDQVPESS